jgi:hypothetical protein
MELSMFLTFPQDSERRLNIWTNIGLLISIVLGLIVAAAHGGEVTVTIAAFGAALGTGGVLGFLFGVPGASQANISIGRVDTVAVGAGQGAKVTGGTVNEPAPIAPSPVRPQNPAPATVAVVAAPNDVTPAATAQSVTDPTLPPSGGTGAPQTTATSNLEQVADWVTKLLLGGGLTQMQRIPPKIWQWSRNVAIGITDGKATDAALQAQQAFAAGVLVYGFILGFFAGFLITKLQLGKRVA